MWPGLRVLSRCRLCRYVQPRYARSGAPRQVRRRSSRTQGPIPIVIRKKGSAQHKASSGQTVLAPAIVVARACVSLLVLCLVSLVSEKSSSPASRRRLALAWHGTLALSPRSTVVYSVGYPSNMRNKMNRAAVEEWTQWRDKWALGLWRQRGCTWIATSRCRCTCGLANKDWRIASFAVSLRAVNNVSLLESC